VRRETAKVTGLDGAAITRAALGTGGREKAISINQFIQEIRG
jgi:hypothetical protein